MLALARKYRPKKFAEVAVQTHVSNTLRGAIARDRVAHGYLLCGPRGVGKTTLARVLAMALNCENRDASGEPCGQCASCTRIWSGASSLDVVEIDAASNRGVDDARDLRERAMYAPSGENRWKVYIIDEAHMLTREAWNALLKILEEPPPRVVFVFATTEPHKIAQFAAPVLSRLQRFDFKRIAAADIRARLADVLAQERIEAEPEALAVIARAADGSMRDALSLTDQALALGDGRLTVERARDALGLVAEDEYLAILDIIAEGRAGDVFGAVSRLVDQGVDLGQFLAGLSEMLRAQLAVQLGGDPGDASERVRTALRERKDRLAAGDLLRMLTMLAELEPRFRRSTQQQLLLETTLVRLALLDRTVDIEELLRGLERGSAAPPDTRASGGGGRGPRMRSAPASDAPGSVASSRESDEGRQATPRSAATVRGAMLRDVSVDATRTVAAHPSGGTTLGAVHVSDINAIAGVWDDVISEMRRSMPVVATLLEQAIPTGASASGVLTLQADSPAVQDGLTARAASIVGVLQPRIAGLQRIVVQAAGAPVGNGERMTVEMVRASKLQALRQRDAVLAAAIDELDLDLVD
ncbi:MAG TPA: DNA polymerase III subunit gamma/tau [Gemmatimonadaceae bacterium]